MKFLRFLSVVISYVSWSACVVLFNLMLFLFVSLNSKTKTESLQSTCKYCFLNNNTTFIYFGAAEFY